LNNSVLYNFLISYYTRI